ncbi:hemoglobin subunit beta-2-like [Engystomops pustulosus]|uniref:hemoglobin subunit beta-2-like n=1 Tax=Engystomops pustulosus TaxID=76066 RepID=UPI003AFAD96A
MVHWTSEEKAILTSTWAKVDIDADGQEALTRLLIVYPWTQRYFSFLDHPSSFTIIAGNPKVKADGRLVLKAIGNAIQHLDEVKHCLANLSKIHAQKLLVDPGNFKHMAKILVLVLAMKLGTALTPQVQAVWEKFGSVLVAAMSQAYF